MNLRHDPIRSTHPLKSRQLNAHIDCIWAECIDLIGIEASGQIVREGLYDVLDDRSGLDASGLYNHHTTSIHEVLEMQQELLHIQEG